MTPELEDVSPRLDIANLDEADMADHTLDSDDSLPSKETSVQPGVQKSNVNVKDPLRPKRKKARRACVACQRAHLTCGDERPCQRCIKRGLQNQCHDGVRKKAKYLHDAPAEALLPGARSTFGSFGQPRSSSFVGGSSMLNRPTTLNPHMGYYSRQEPTNYALYQQSTTQPQLASMGQGPAQVDPFGNQSNNSPTHYLQGGQQSPPLQDDLPTASQALPVPQDQQWFDASDPELYNFDLASLNFANEFGALEFGMLGHMSSGAAESPETLNLMGAISGSAGPINFSNTLTGNTGYTDSPASSTDMVYPSVSPMGEWSQFQNNSEGAAGQLFNAQMQSAEHGSYLHSQYEPHAYAIGSGNSLPSGSPGSYSQEYFSAIDQGQISPTLLVNMNQQQPAFDSSPASQRQQGREHQYDQTQRSRNPQQQYPVKPIVPLNAVQSVTTRKRRRDPSAIYSTVEEPYSYTTGFHNLTALIQRRFSPPKTLRIAKALASIRPSFISCTKTLNRDDLVFMEKCFQRTLWEYEDFINFCGTPTIVCRRTGEIAAVGKEFSILTGWKKEVLLGKEPNLNVNTGRSLSANATASSRGGFNTPRIPTADERRNFGDETRPQPVYLAELLDDDSVVQFYEDFAKLAFGDSRGSVIAPCKLLKYKTKDDPGYLAEEMAVRKAGTAGSDAAQHDQLPRGQETFEDYQARQQRQRLSPTSRQRQNTMPAGNATTVWDRAVANISGEAGMNRLGEREGMVECTYCWTVKRDVFDIPMLIVMNFLPCI